MPVAFPKPKGTKRKIDPVRIFPDGREICYKESVEGRWIYQSRTTAMVMRQKGRCCLEMYCPVCPGALSVGEATFEHENGRGGGKRDDRIILPNGQWINGAAHAACNMWKGSRYLDYNRSFQDA